MMIILHNYSDGSKILVNPAKVEYIVATDKIHATSGLKANAIVSFSEETGFWVTETLEQIEELLRETAK